MTEEGMRCHSCGTTHLDWEKTGENAVRSKHYSGIEEELECGRCGATTEQLRR